MGVNDAAEMLEAAQEECIRLERVIAAADVSMFATPAGFRDRFWDRTRAILAQSHGDPLAEHDRAVKAEALEQSDRDWANYIENWGSSVGDPDFTRERLLALLRGPRPFGSAAGSVKAGE